VAADAPVVLVVGELNPFGADPRLALYHLPRTSSGNHLRLIMGLSDADYLRLARVNLCEGRWDAERARREAARLQSRAAPGSALVLLGARVASAFRVPTPFRVSRADGVHVLSLPHPSGRCRTWNDPSAVGRARDLLRVVAPWVAWGGHKDHT